MTFVMTRKKKNVHDITKRVITQTQDKRLRRNSHKLASDI